MDTAPEQAFSNYLQEFDKRINQIISPSQSATSEDTPRKMDLL